MRCSPTLTSAIDKRNNNKKTAATHQPHFTLLGLLGVMRVGVIRVRDQTDFAHHPALAALSIRNDDTFLPQTDAWVRGCVGVCGCACRFVALLASILPPSVTASLLFPVFARLALTLDSEMVHLSLRRLAIVLMVCLSVCHVFAVR